MLHQEHCKKCSSQFLYTFFKANLNKDLLSIRVSKLSTDFVNGLHEAQVVFSSKLDAELHQMFSHSSGEGGEGVAHDGQAA